MGAPTKKSIILGLLAEGKSQEEICAAHPDYRPAYVRQVIREKEGTGTPPRSKGSRTVGTDTLEELLTAVRDGRIDGSALQIQISIKISGTAATASQVQHPETAAPEPPEAAAGIAGFLNPIDLYRQWGEDVTSGLLKRCDLAALRQIVRLYVPDRRGSALKWQDKDKVIAYICDRAKALSQHGQAFTCD